MDFRGIALESRVAAEFRAELSLARLESGADANGLGGHGASHPISPEHFRHGDVAVFRPHSNFPRPTQRYRVAMPLMAPPVTTVCPRIQSVFKR